MECNNSARQAMVEWDDAPVAGKYVLTQIWTVVAAM